MELSLVLIHCQRALQDKQSALVKLLLYSAEKLSQQTRATFSKLLKAAKEIWLA